MRRRLAVSLSCLLAATVPVSADELLGVPVPAWPVFLVRAGCYPPPCAPHDVNTWLTPFVASEAGVIGAWRGQFVGGRATFGCVLPTRIQLKVLRATSPTTVEVVAAGAVHDPKAILEARFGYACPQFPLGSEASLIEFPEAGVEMAPGDALGLAVGSDPAVGLFLYPFVNTGALSWGVNRDVAVGDTIDVTSVYTGRYPWLPALQVVVTPVSLDADGDGLADAADACPASAPAAVVDASGCSIDDRCPCAGPPWRNHGAYVSCVAHAAEALMLSGVIDAAQKDAAVSAAAASACGRKR